MANLVDDKFKSIETQEVGASLNSWEKPVVAE